MFSSYSTTSHAELHPLNSAAAAAAMLRVASGSKLYTRLYGRHKNKMKQQQQSFSCPFWRERREEELKVKYCSSRVC
jgi:hypothetical protein